MNDKNANVCHLPTFGKQKPLIPAKTSVASVAMPLIEFKFTSFPCLDVILEQLLKM